MRTAVVDASVAVKWVLNEEHGAQARSLLGSVLHAPDHWMAEALHAVVNRARRGDIPPADATEAARLLAKVAVRGAALAPLAMRAYDIAMEARVTAYDAFYPALAERLGVPLVTADRRLLQRLADAQVAEGLALWVGDLR